MVTINPIIWNYTVSEHIFHLLRFFSIEGTNSRKTVNLIIVRYLVHDINPFLLSKLLMSAFSYSMSIIVNHLLQGTEGKKIYRSRNRTMANHPKRPTAITEKALNKQITKNDLYALQ